MPPTTTIAELVRARRDEILRIAARHGAHNVRVFGSVARGEVGPESDLDLLVDFEPDRSLLDQGALLMDMQGLFPELRVDIFEVGSLRPRVRIAALRDAVTL
ncbi:MAG TPA: nucleotidyltransferase domain-containing protein [Thermomicrobiaceae bacterium]|nr:nucleotidyltransferase domain-containing protein [Thermomicrobiaceae bacterium]